MTLKHYGVPSERVLIQNKQGLFERDIGIVQDEDRDLERMDFTEGSALGVFTCELCELSSPYSFYGQKPPNTRAIV